MSKQRLGSVRRRSRHRAVSRQVEHSQTRKTRSTFATLVQEQERALRMQEQFSQQDRMDMLQRQNSQHQHPSQNSPLNHPLHNPADRKPLLEDRAPTSSTQHLSEWHLLTAVTYNICVRSAGFNAILILWGASLQSFATEAG